MTTIKDQELADHSEVVEVEIEEVAMTEEIVEIDHEVVEVETERATVVVEEEMAVVIGKNFEYFIYFTNVFYACFNNQIIG